MGGASNVFNECKKMAIPTTEITLALDNRPIEISFGKHVGVSEKTYDRHTSSKKHHRSTLPVINPNIILKTSGMKCGRGSINRDSIQKSLTTNILPKM